MEIAFIAFVSAVVTLCVLAFVCRCKGAIAFPGSLRRVAVLSQSEAIPSMRESMPLIEQEFGRARRHERSLCVAVLEIRDRELLDQIRSLMSVRSVGFASKQREATQVVRVVFGLIGCVLRDALRDTDIVSYDPESDRYVVVLPDSGRQEAVAAVERVREMLLKRTAAETRFGVAELPDNGLVFPDLLSAARVACGPESRTSDHARVA